MLYIQQHDSYYSVAAYRSMLSMGELFSIEVIIHQCLSELDLFTPVTLSTNLETTHHGVISSITEDYNANKTIVQINSRLLGLKPKQQTICHKQIDIYSLFIELLTQLGFAKSSIHISNELQNKAINIFSLPNEDQYAFFKRLLKQLDLTYLEIGQDIYLINSWRDAELQKRHKLKIITGKGLIPNSTPEFNYAYPKLTFNETTFLSLAVAPNNYNLGDQIELIGSNCLDSEYIIAAIEYTSKTNTQHITLIECCKSLPKIQHPIDLPLVTKAKYLQEASVGFSYLNPNPENNHPCQRIYKSNQAQYFPLQPGTEILINFPTNDFKNPIIVGAIPKTNSKPLVNSKMNATNIISAQDYVINFDNSKNSLDFFDTRTKSNLNFSSAKLNIAANNTNLRFSSEDNLTFKATQAWNSSLEYGYNFISQADWLLTSKNNNYTFNNGIFRATQQMLITSQHKLAMDVKNNFELTTQQQLALKTKHGDANGKDASLFLTANENLTVSSTNGKITLSSKYAQIKLYENNSIDITAKLIEFSSAKVQLNGKINLQN